MSTFPTRAKNYIKQVITTYSDSYKASGTIKYFIRGSIVDGILVFTTYRAEKNDKSLINRYFICDQDWYDDQEDVSYGVKWLKARRIGVLRCDSRKSKPALAEGLVLLRRRKRKRLTKKK